MKIGKLEESNQERSWILRLLYPVCLVQEFEPSLGSNVISYFTECDQVHHELFKDRIRWLDAMHIKYKFSYTTEKHWPDLAAGVTYVLHISFSSRKDAAAYKLAWS